MPICRIEVPSFLDDSTNICTPICPAGFYADNSTMICVAVCPSDPDYFAFNISTDNGVCVLFCPFQPTPYYRYN